MFYNCLPLPVQMGQPGAERSALVLMEPRYTHACVHKDLCNPDDSLTHSPETLLTPFWVQGFFCETSMLFMPLDLKNKNNTAWNWLLGDIDSEKWALVVHIRDPLCKGNPAVHALLREDSSCICPEPFLNRKMHKMNCLRALFLRWGFWEGFCVLCNKKLQSYLLLYASFWCGTWCQHQNSVLCWAKRTIGSSMMLISVRLSDNSGKLVNQSHTLQWPDLVAPSRNEILQSRTYISPIKTLDVC